MSIGQLQTYNDVIFYYIGGAGTRGGRIRLHFCLWQKLRSFRHQAGGKEDSTGVLHFTFESVTMQKELTPKDVSSFWWGRTDSNHRSETQQIYSLSPLATRELPHIQLLFVGALHPNSEWSR